MTPLKNFVRTKFPSGVIYRAPTVLQVFIEQGGKMQRNMFVLTVTALYISRESGAMTVQVPEIALRPHYGILGDTHAGEDWVSDTGEVVTNLRQFTAVNPRELGEAAEKFGVPYIDPAWIK